MLYFKSIKINAIVNELLLTGDKFIPKIHLKQPAFTHGVCGPFTKNKERIKKLRKQEIQHDFIKTI